MSRCRAAVLAALMVIAGGSHVARGCNFVSGEERWSIKTSVPATPEPAGAAAVDVQSVIDLPNPKLSRAQRAALQDNRLGRSVRIDGRTFHEGDIVSLEGYLYRTKCEHDGDYHIEIGSTPTRTAQGCLIVEIPDPDQIASADLREAITAARSALEAGAHEWERDQRRIRIVGQLFLDESHAEAESGGGGRGTARCARHLWEIHPVTSIGVVAETANRQ